MFTTNHIIWIVISLILIALFIFLLLKYKPKMQTVENIMIVVLLLAEFIKAFFNTHMYPSMSGDHMYQYLNRENLPFHMCNIYIFLMLIVRFTKNEKLRNLLYGFMYPMCIVGAFIPVFIPTVFTTDIDISQAFTHILAYRFFIFHCALVAFGVYIPLSKQIDLKFKNFYSSITLLLGLAIVSMYLNSVFADPIYVDGVVKYVEYTPNYFFTFRPPIDSIKINSIGDWAIYLGALIAIATLLMFVFYLPYLNKEKKEKAKQQ